MHFPASYVTGPAAVFFRAPTRHADAHAGSWQCMHIRRTYLSPCSSITVKAVGDSFASVSFGNPCRSLQACSQLRHPMHFVTSTKMALVRSIPFSFVTMLVPSMMERRASSPAVPMLQIICTEQIEVGPRLRQEKFPHQPLSQIRR